MVIKNWKLFLEYTDTDFNIVKDIFVELEDEFGVEIDYDNRVDDDIVCIMNITTNIDQDRNNEIVDFTYLLCQKIEGLTNYICDFQLTFTSEQGNIVVHLESPKSSWTVQAERDLLNYRKDRPKDGLLYSKSSMEPTHPMTFVDKEDLNARIFKYFYIWIYRN